MRRLRAPQPLDSALALVLSVWWIAETGKPTAVGLASLVLMTAPLAWRRSMPLAAMALVAAGFVIGYLQPDPPEPLAALVAFLVAPYTVAVYARDWRAAVAGGVVAVGGGATGALLAGGEDLGFIMLLASVAWAVGASARSLRDRSSELAERAAVLDERARTAAAGERERIARELHDVVSHSVSLMVVQAGAAEQVLRHDPDQAVRALEALQSTGRSAVDDLRRMLGLLRGPSAGAGSRAPQPGLAELDALVDSMVASGLSVAIERGDLPPLPAGVELAAYRVVQESLTNAAKHAAGHPTRVRIDYTSGTLRLESRTSTPPHANGSSAGPGHGLIGMRERVALYGGELEVGFDERDDWVVSASLRVGR